MMNSRQVEQLFAEECVLVGERDVLPFSIAIDIFGEDAVEFAKSFKGGYNLFGIDGGDYNLCYLTFRGVQLAVTYSNIREIQKMERMNLDDVERREAHKIIDLEERRRQA